MGVIAIILVFLLVLCVDSVHIGCCLETRLQPHSTGFLAHLYHLKYPSSPIISSISSAHTPSVSVRCIDPPSVCVCGHHVTLHISPKALDDIASHSPVHVLMTPAAAAPTAHANSQLTGGQLGLEVSGPATFLPGLPDNCSAYLSPPLPHIMSSVQGAVRVT